MNTFKLFVKVVVISIFCFIAQSFITNLGNYIYPGLTGYSDPYSDYQISVNTCKNDKKTESEIKKCEKEAEESYKSELSKYRRDIIKSIFDDLLNLLTLVLFVFLVRKYLSTDFEVKNYNNNFSKRNFKNKK